jgi:hypothetical protein
LRSRTGEFIAQVGNGRRDVEGAAVLLAGRREFRSEQRQHRDALPGLLELDEAWEGPFAVRIDDVAAEDGKVVPVGEALELVDADHEVEIAESQSAKAEFLPDAQHRIGFESELRLQFRGRCGILCEEVARIEEEHVRVLLAVPFDRSRDAVDTPGLADHAATGLDVAVQAGGVDDAQVGRGLGPLRVTGREGREQQPDEGLGDLCGRSHGEGSTGWLTASGLSDGHTDTIGHRWRANVPSRSLTDEVQELWPRILDKAPGIANLGPG